jgi:hypothetical protein
MSWFVGKPAMVNEPVTDDANSGVKKWDSRGTGTTKIRKGWFNDVQRRGMDWAVDYQRGTVYAIWKDM